MRLYRPSEAALISGINYGLISQWIHRGIIELTIVDQAPMISHDELERVVRDRVPDKLHLLQKAEHSNHDPIED